MHEFSSLSLPDQYQELNARHSWNQFVVRVKSFPKVKESNATNLNLTDNKGSNDLMASIARDFLKRKLSDQGINTIIYYPIPIHLQPIYQNLGYKEGDLKNTEDLCCQVLSLPIFPELSIDQQDYIIDSIKTIIWA